MIARERVLEILKDVGALLEGHFLLTSGRHSEKYLQCAKIFQYAKYAEELCADLAARFAEFGAEVVVGPAVGAIQMSYEVSRTLGVKNLFAERENGEMTLRRGFSIEKGQKVLVVEDVTTTGGTVREILDLVRRHGGEPVGVGLVVDRSGGKIDFGVPIKSVISLEVESFAPESCPVCKTGKPLVKPGSRA
jgi:orotate phosphoribosyltransferase